MSLCSDGSGFFNRGNRSWGPLTAICFNLPPWLRNKFASIFMFGVMPSKIKNYKRTHSRCAVVVIVLVHYIVHIARRTGDGLAIRLHALHVGGTTKGSRPARLELLHRAMDEHLASYRPPHRGQCGTTQARVLPQTARANRYSNTAHLK